MLQDLNVERVIKNYTEPLQKQISMMQIELEALKQQLNIGAVSISLERSKKYARHQHFLGTQGSELVEFEDWAAKD